MRAGTPANPTHLSKGGMAIDARGDPADMPRDMAHSINRDLMDTVTLLHCAMNEAGDAEVESQHAKDKLTSPSSRAVSLLSMADEKVRAVLSAITPYV